ncbi:S-layer homology domain-containing protein [Candidatus Gracilibacteria bacterium]|nr:S-layer homology domain-containing protein [Candidatus Gracilibacteria bacterium]
MSSKKLLLFPVLFIFSTISCAYADFADTQYSWYHDSIEKLHTEGLVSGVGENKFGTELAITRAEILTILLRASNTTLPPITTTETCFLDVNINMWYHPYICGANTLGIAHGFESGLFQPNSTVTTLEALAFGVKAFGISVPLAEGEKWYEPLQKFANDNNILQTHGYTLSTKISRGKSAELILRLREYSQTKSSLNYKSPGCQVNSPIMSGENTIIIDGKERKYNLFVPSGYSNSREYSLAIATHGRTNSKDQVQAYMGLQKGQSDTIVVYPAALRSSSGSSFSWAEKENMVFIDAILKQISDTYCINRNQVYAIGHSLGGWMAQRIACLRGEFMSGLAVVGSGGFNGTCTGPVPSLFFQNVNDQLSSYASGVSARDIRLQVNECKETTESVQIGSLSCTKYTTCSPGNQVVWCEGYTGYNGDPHSWPTEGRSGTGGTWILNFFKELRG